MKVSILCVGKIKEKFYTDAIAEYAKRLTRFCDFDITEIPDEKIPDKASDKEKEMIKEREGEKLLSKLKPDSFAISLCIEGKTLSSEELADTMQNIYNNTNHVTFIIGGSLGLSDAVKAKTKLRLSIGRMTLNHLLMRVVLSEEIYRSFMINQGGTYHK